ncbi:hypothetical protein [Streptacidiphilus anmyonensis]|uniref:hypothetical protein n=1 Tax=Streptacidiphilus anmyonensis TaxID=405782 RepID=UPI00128CB61F|nr:hypothetical protein [Streptacidiphilus anmyonensis]
MKTSQILTLSAALAAAGLLLLSGGPVAGPRAHGAATKAPVATAPAAAATSSPAAPTPPVAPATEAGSTDTAAARPSALPTNVLAPDDGPGGDHLVQAMLDAHSPHNLPPRVEQRLDQLGRAVWLADVTGRSRDQWPGYFTTSGTSGYSGVRIQAASAHATGPGRATVTLIWAGTSPAGDPEVGLPGTVALVKRGDGAWEPVR